MSKRSVTSTGYDDHSSDVWHVVTQKREVVVRASKLGGPDSVFWKGCNLLFGIDPSDVPQYKARFP